MTATSKYTDQSAARRKLRREVPSAAAVLADEQDFRAMRRYRTFPFDDHRSYLQQMERLLRTLASQGVLTTISLFDPLAYEKYCADLALDPDRPDSRSRYTAEVARTGATLTYQGEPLSRLLPLLVEEAGRQATWDHASAVLARAGDCPECGEDLAHAAFARATQALQQLLETLGSGTHHLVCSVATGDPSLLAVLQATAQEGTRRRLAESDTLIFCTVLAAGFALRTPGGIVSRTTPGPAGHDTTGAPAQDTVRGWSLRDSWPRALSAAEVFTAYCTDADTGEPIPPEHGVDYAPGLPLTPPPDPHHHD
ncbi:hypothetical protein YWIDRAFT_04209 [Streptomyces sp. SceaMP-e96]|uniref:hypothetical protein n=1 Tax=unclassified Streptomyces TaxID=2593676 RepID=UPI000823BAD6|nr:MULTISPECIES: hypothetical protein [unclassified Streptomyces]MYT14784.1 hypothetical protein [Streptomyces sp. SID4951]SCK16768.1 hypothetical protein YWIDRAFT_04209 [Streptomyces sp. SceaMP-e96]